jgi:branched-chain amino acid transport system permease protein
VVVSLLAMTAGLLAFTGGSAHAQESEFAIRVRVLDQQRDASGRADNQPVPGVSITVVDADGNEVGTAVTDAEGSALIPVPARADYVVRLDESTLPDDTGLTGESTAEENITPSSFITSTTIITFFTGESQSADQSGLEKVAQRFTDGLRLGLVLAMCSVGLSLIFGTTGLTNFAHGEMVTFGGMMAFLLNVTGVAFLAFLPIFDDDGRLPLLLAAPIAVALGGLFGWLFDWVIFARLRRRGIGLITQLVVTVGLAIMLRNMFLFFFKGRTRPLRDFSLQEGIGIGPVTITPRDLTTAAISLVVLVAVALALQRTRLGKATRAVSDNPDLASATGINTQQVIRMVWVLAGALAALGGIFRALDEQVGFDMGSRLLFLMFAAITLGGLGSAYGALVGGIIVGVLVELATLVVPTELKNTPALAILIIVLLVRPQGILGRSERVG